MKHFYTYIMVNKRNGTLYVGSTSNLIRRVWQHKNNLVNGFSKKYRIHYLAYYEVHESYVEAARREKRIKHWPRQWKLNLIKNMNPFWKDIFHEIIK